MTSRLAIAGLFALAAGGCANLASFEMGALPVPPGSPVDLAAREAARNPGPMPSFADIPRTSEARPEPAGAGPDPSAVNAQAAALRAEAARTPLLSEMEIAAEAARMRAPVAGVETPTDATAEAEAFARAARARATPPPPPS